MSELTATFLGTGTSQGVPVIACDCEVCQSNDPLDKRFRSSMLISKGEQNVVIDTGPDFRQQMLREKVLQLDGILFTHEHKDHIAGMDDIRAYNFRAKKAMEVYATPAVQESLIREFHYVFADFKYPGVPEVNLNTIDQEPVELMGESFIPMDVMHLKLPVKAFRVRDFAYITDANFIPDETFEKLKGVKTLVLNALRKEKHLSHFNLDEAIEISRKIGAEKTYFTHISHLLGRHQDISEELPDGIELAYDGLKIDI